MKSGWMQKDEEKYCGGDRIEPAEENWEEERKSSERRSASSISEIYGKGKKEGVKWYNLTEEVESYKSGSVL